MLGNISVMITENEQKHHQHMFPWWNKSATYIILYMLLNNISWAVMLYSLPTLECECVLRNSPIPGNHIKAVSQHNKLWILGNIYYNYTGSYTVHCNKHIYISTSHARNNLPHTCTGHKLWTIYYETQDLLTTLIELLQSSQSTTA